MPEYVSRPAAVLQAHEPRNPHGDGRYVPALDGWRAIAILLVMLFHSVANVADEGIGGRLGRVVGTISHLGAMGVLIFFAISGYIITTRLYAEAPGGDISLRIFYARRCFRILPAMAVYLLVLVVLHWLHLIRLQREDLFAPLFLSNYFPDAVYTAHFWSLAIEEHFYLLWPLCLLLAGWRRAIYVGCGLMIAVGVYRAFRLAQLGVVDAAPGFIDGARGYFLAHTEARIDYILAGCVLALLLIFNPWAKRLVRWCGTGTGVVVLVVAILISSRVSLVDLHSLQACAIALLVVATSVGSASFLNRILSVPLLVWLGKLSYSLYLWQQLFLARTSIPFLQSPFGMVPRLGGALLAAWLSYRFIERPFIRFGSSYIQRWKTLPGS